MCRGSAPSVCSKELPSSQVFVLNVLAQHVHINMHTHTLTPPSSRTITICLFITRTMETTNSTGREVGEGVEGQPHMLLAQGTLGQPHMGQPQGQPHMLLAQGTLIRGRGRSRGRGRGRGSWAWQTGATCSRTDRGMRTQRLWWWNLLTCFRESVSCCCCTGMYPPPPHMTCMYPPPYTTDIRLCHVAAAKCPATPAAGCPCGRTLHVQARYLNPKP